MKRKLILSAILFISSSISFAIGYLSNQQFNHAPIIIEKCSHNELSNDPPQ